MWWLDPGKEILHTVFNRILAPYVENLDLSNVNYGISQGHISLSNLQLKKGALDKFKLPIDVIRGHLGKFSLSLHWVNLGNKPVEVWIEDVYLLVVPSQQGDVDQKEEEERALAIKRERLDNSELLREQTQAQVPTDSSAQQPKGLWDSVFTKIVNNLQVTVKNIHIRYEDKLSVPGHPFAAGLTLAGFTAVSVNEKWEPAFIDSSAGAIHKLANLQSLAIYFDTDSASLSGLSPSETIQNFASLISHEKDVTKHQFILRPVSGEGRIVMNHQLNKETPQWDVHLMFQEIGVALDNYQYRDVISLLDMYHVYVRRQQYRKYRPSEEEFTENRPRALLQFAGKAIFDGVHEYHRKWTWTYFAERRDDRKAYIDLYTKRMISPLTGNDLSMFEALERKLSYQDIRFYRSIVRSHLRTDAALRRKLEEEKNKQQAQSQGWISWMWGTPGQDKGVDPAFGQPMTEEQRRQLYEALDYDEKAALAASLEAPRDALKLRATTELKTGSFRLLSKPNGEVKEVISVTFDIFQATLIQRPDNFEASVSLGGFGVFDGTTAETLYPQIVQVKASKHDAEVMESLDDPFFYVKFENNPLDERADNALTVRMRPLEIIYHKGYVEAIYNFFKPPASQLESVEALLASASQTLEGLRKETRAGLEYALQTHKTVDVQVDMSAPVIIIPESVMTTQCIHLLLDAGQIAIESDLADKSAVQEIQSKRNQQYSEEDYRRLESLMYDRFSLRLEAAQFIMGNDLQSCRDALTSPDHDDLHLLERVNVGLQLQNSIVPSARNLARFKVSGDLPNLQINFSDSKYKSLMRLIEVCLPKFDDPAEESSENHTSITQGPVLQLPSGFFGKDEAEYNVDENAEDDHHFARKEDQFSEAEDNGNRGDLHQHIFEFNFQVHTLQASIRKMSGPASERPLGDVSLNHFALAFSLTKYDMRVDIKLRSISMNVDQNSAEPLKFISSSESNSAEDKDLLTVGYVRVQKASPEFMTVYGGVDQSVDIAISTFIFRAAPEPVLSLYDFIMTTFVPQTNQGSIVESPVTEDNQTQLESAKNEVPPPGKIRVSLKLASVKVILVNGSINLATLSLSTASVVVALNSGAMRISGRLGNLSLRDDSDLQTSVPDFKQIMSIEGENLAEFSYQTFDSHEALIKGVKSSISLNAASLKVHYLEQPLHDMYLFAMKLAKLKGLYDAATQAAVQTASQIDRMQFDISVKTPIITFPSNAIQSPDVLVLRLGEMAARNSYDKNTHKISAGLHGIQFVSTIYSNNDPCQLKIIDDINISAQVAQTLGIDRNQDIDFPDAQVSVEISDVKLHLTQVQYGLLVALSQSIPRVLSGAPEGVTQAEIVASSDPTTSSAATPQEESNVDLQPELRVVPSKGAANKWTSLDLVVTMQTVKLHLYDHEATSENSIRDHGIARFALNNNSLRCKMLSDGSVEAQVVLKSFTMSNTRPGDTKFREMIPAVQHDRNQFMILYTMSGENDKSALAILTIDSPEIIFAVDPIISLLAFVTSAVPKATEDEEDVAEGGDTSEVDSETAVGQSRLDFRVDLHDVSVVVLENDSDPDSQAIRLSIQQVSMSQQSVVALTIDQLGMSLMRMGKSSEVVRFLDDVDIAFSLDNRGSAPQQMTNMEISIKPVVFRASYRDINLITSIVNKAVELYSKTQQSPPEVRSDAPDSYVSARPSHVRKVGSKATSSRSGKSRPHVHVVTVMSKEQLKCTCDGFRLVLIGDLHEQPMLHLRVKPFVVDAKDWSNELQATTTLAVNVSYWNLTNSHWEPLIDPWTFTSSVSKDSSSGGLHVGLSARENLDINISTTFIELALTTMKQWQKEGQRLLQKARGSYAPYRIKNRTGSPIHVWTDGDPNNNSRDSATIKIANDQTIDWRFDDWKTMREHVTSSAQHNIGIEFIGKSWDRLRSIPVDREGEFTYTLRPRTEKYPSRLLCEVKVQDNVKMVIIRSTYKIANETLYPLEVTLVDDAGHPIYSLEKISPGQDFALPIEAVTKNRIRIQPDQGFGYKWCPALKWEDLVSKRSFTIKCPHTDSREAAFRFQAWVETDAESSSRRSPKINLKLRAPIELENLLPCNLTYRIYDKDADQNWRSYLREGGIMPVHSVELGHMVLLNIQLEDTVFKPSEFAIINTDGHSDFEIERRLTLHDSNDRKLDLRLNYVRYPDSGGAFKVQIYTPYLIVNKTGLDVLIRSVRSSRPGQSQDVAGDTRPESTSRPTPFMLSHYHENGHDFSFKFSTSSWSRPLSFEAPAADTALVIPSQSDKSQELHVGLSWTEGLGKYKLTKVIDLAPRFLIKNNLSDPLSFREHGVAPKRVPSIGTGERSPLHFLRARPDRLLTAAYTGLSAQWTPPINIEDIGSVYLRLKAPQDQDVEQLVRADVKLETCTVFVMFSSAEEGWPFALENISDYTVYFCQTAAHSGNDGQTPFESHVRYTAGPRETINYVWDYPAVRDKKIQLIINDFARVVDILEIGDLVPFKFNDGQRTRAVSLDVRAEGHKQILRITNYNMEKSVYKPKHRTSTGLLTRSDTIGSNSDVFEAVTEEIPPALMFSVDFNRIGVSLINRKLVEVIYLSLEKMKFEYTDSPVAQSVTLSCGTLQVDNQLHDAIFPVILQPTPIPKEAREAAAQPTVQGSVIWLKDQAHGVFFIKYCSILLQALTIEADEDLLFSIYDFTKVRGAFWEEEVGDVLIENPGEIPEPKDTGARSDLYFEVLELQPIKLFLSFMRTERVSTDEKLNFRNPLLVIVNALAMTLGNINDAPLELNALAIKDMRLSLPELQNRIVYHYRQDVIRQLYRILGSADFFGNPVGLFTNVSSGVADIFYEPFNGAVMHGNGDVGIGIAKGAASFVKKTVFGVSDSVSKITSSVGKGLSAATFDSEYQNRRRMTQRRNKPRHAIYGVAAGGEALASSVASAVEGVLMKPIEGAESGGAVGFFKGVGKGLVGAVTKPVVGVFDMASNVSAGIRNTTTVFDSPERDRVRLPRQVPSDGVLVPYSARESLGQYWMKDLENGVYRSESYVAHINTPGGDNVALLTTSRVLSFWSRKLRLDWDLPFSMVQGVTVEDTGIRFAHKAGRDSDKFVFIPDKSSQSWFFTQVAGVVKAFNARRRMDA